MGLLLPYLHHSSLSQLHFLSNAPSSSLHHSLSPRTCFSIHHLRENQNKVFPLTHSRFFLFFIQFLRFLIRSLCDSEGVGESRPTPRSATISANFSLRLAFRMTTFPPPRSFCSTDGAFAFLRTSAFCFRLLRLRMSIVNSRYSIFCFWNSATLKRNWVVIFCLAEMLENCESPACMLLCVSFLLINHQCHP